MFCAQRCLLTFPQVAVCAVRIYTWHAGQLYSLVLGLGQLSFQSGWSIRLLHDIYNLYSSHDIILFKPASLKFNGAYKWIAKDANCQFPHSDFLYQKVTNRILWIMGNPNGSYMTKGMQILAHSKVIQLTNNPSTIFACSVDRGTDYCEPLSPLWTPTPVHGHPVSTNQIHIDDSEWHGLVRKNQYHSSFSNIQHY